MDSTLPAGIIACLDALGGRLLEITREHRDGTLEQLEQAVLEAVRAELPKILSEVVTNASSRMALGRGEASLPEMR